MSYLFFDRTRLLRNCLRFSIICLLLSTVSCGIFSPRTPTKVPVTLSVENAEKEQLFAQINRYAEIKTIRGKVDVKFEDNSFAESGISEKYKAADGQVIVQAPSNINLKIQIPFVGTDLVQMTSDGDKFRVAVLCCVDEKYKRFVYGTNSNEYSALREKAKNATGNNDQNKAISVFSSLRPQHFTDALLMRPVQTENGYFYAKSEIYQEEAGTTKAKSRIARVIRGYYLLDEYKQISQNEIGITRRFWFDRAGGIRLARQQVFDGSGVLETDITYGIEQKFTDSGNYSLPVQVQITRPQERYSVKLTYQTPNAVVIGKTYDQSVFQLENTWQLPEVNLDKQTEQSKLLGQ